MRFANKSICNLELTKGGFVNGRSWTIQTSVDLPSLSLFSLLGAIPSFTIFHTSLRSCLIIELCDVDPAGVDLLTLSRHPQHIIFFGRFLQQIPYNIHMQEETQEREGKKKKSMCISLFFCSSFWSRYKQINEMQMGIGLWTGATRWQA